MTTVCLFFYIFETGFHIVRTFLELIRQLRIFLNSRFSCFYLPSTGIILSLYYIFSSGCAYTSYYILLISCLGLTFVYLLMIIWELPLATSLEILNCRISIGFPLLYVPGTLSCILTLSEEIWTWPSSQSFCFDNGFLCVLIF